MEHAGRVPTGSGRAHSPPADRARDAALVHRLRYVRDRRASVARCARWTEAGPTKDPLHDARGGDDLRRSIQEIGACRGGLSCEIPPTRRQRDLRCARPDGPGLFPPLSACAGSGKLGEYRRRARRDAVYRVPALEGRRGAPSGHRKRHGGVGGQLRRDTEGASRSTGKVPEPPRERLERDRRGDGDEHAPPQPRGDRRRPGPPD